MNLTEQLRTKLAKRTSELAAEIKSVPAIWHDTMGVDSLVECLNERAGLTFEANRLRRLKGKATMGTGDFLDWTCKERSQFVAKAEKLETLCDDLHDTALCLKNAEAAGKKSQ